MLSGTAMAKATDSMGLPGIPMAMWRGPEGYLGDQGEEYIFFSI